MVMKMEMIIIQTIPPFFQLFVSYQRGTDVERIFSIIAQHHIIFRSGLKLTHKIIFYVHNETEISDLKICASMMASSVFIS